MSKFDFYVEQIKQDIRLARARGEKSIMVNTDGFDLTLHEKVSLQFEFCSVKDGTWTATKWRASAWNRWPYDDAGEWKGLSDGFFVSFLGVRDD